MTRNSWRQNLHGRTSQKQTHRHDAFGTVQRNIQWIPTVNIWMVNPSVFLKVKSQIHWDEAFKFLFR